MKHEFDPDMRYPDCMMEEVDKAIPDTERPARDYGDSFHSGYLAAKNNRIDTQCKKRDYWEGVLKFVSREAKTDLRPIEVQEQLSRTDFPAGDFGLKKPNRGVRRGRRNDPDRNIFPVNDGWAPPTKLPNSLNLASMLDERGIFGPVLRHTRTSIS